MFIDIDYDKRKRRYKIHLAKPNKQIIANISEGYEPSYNVKLGNVNELSFSVPYYIDKEDERVENEHIEMIKEKMYIRIKYNDETEWMIIDSLEDVGEGNTMSLTVNAFSNIYETRHKRITELQLEAVNPTQYYSEILEDTSWKLGIIDATFKEMYRTFDIGESTTLEAILEGGSTFGAILDFDSENKVINLVDINQKAQYRGLKINYNNFLTSINRKRDTDSMATRLYVYGSEDLSISRVNPTGMPYLEDFSYFLYPFERDINKNVVKSSHYMSDELAHAILDLEELTEQYAPQIKAKQEVIDEKTITTINMETDLSNLEFDVNTIKGLLDIAKATADASLITQRQQELANAENLATIRREELEEVRKEVDRLDQEIFNLQNSISVTSFTSALRDELNPFIIESEFRDDRYIDDRELYDDAVKKFLEAKTPNVTIDASIENIIDSLEEEYFADKIVLGDRARIVDEDMNIDFQSLIIELVFGLDSNECQLVIANEPSELDGFDKILSVLYNTQSTTSRLENSKHKWDSVSEVRTEVDEMRDGGIDAVRQRITAGVNESVVIDDRGIVLSNPDFPNELVIMQAGVIALSLDGGENWSTSITPSGVIADTIIGRLIASNNLLITNESGSFVIDSEGLTIDMDSIKIMSGTAESPQNILDSWNQVILTMQDFANDNVLNAYEKTQIKRQWDSIIATHSSMIQVAQDAYGPETPENPYPVEYDRYVEAYENLNQFLNTTLQSDGHTILDPNTMDNTSPVDSVSYNNYLSGYQKQKDLFQTVIPLDFAQSSIEILEQGISLNYVKNGEVATKLNLSEEGVKIDGRLLEINSKTEFNDDLTMNAGVIRSKDNGIVIDLNAGFINLSKPLTINAVPVVTQDDLDKIELQEGKSAYEIALEYGFTGTEEDWLSSLEGLRGEQGVEGENSYLHVAWADSADGKIGFTQINTTNKLYMGIYTSDSPTSSALAENYKWTKIKGDKGENAPLVKLSGDTQIIKVDEDGNVTPTSTFTIQGVGLNTAITQWLFSTDGGDFSSLQPLGVLRDGNIVTVSPQSSTFKLLVIRASDGKVNDEFTIARTNDGLAGKDAYTVLLSNESHTFAGTETYAVLANTTTTVMAYKGTTRIPVTINSVTGLPTGMTASITKNNTVDAGVTFTVNNSLVTVSGKVEIRMTIDGKGVSKDFSYALALKGVKGETGDVGPRGATGEQGPRGDQGTSVTGVTEWYLATSLSSGVTTTTSGWTNAIQTMTTDKRFLWNYEQIGFSDERTQDTIPVIIGAYGQTGGTGATGATGRSIVSIEENYLASASASGITRTTGGWTTAIQTTDATKKYLWNYEKITWSSAPLVTYVEPIIIGVHGEKGAKGDTGDDGYTPVKGVDYFDGQAGQNGKDSYTHIRYSQNSDGSSMTTSPSNALYIGIAVTQSATPPASNTGFNWSKIKGDQGVKGEIGANGENSYLHIKYSNDGQSFTGNTGENLGAYIGMYVDNKPEDSTIPTMYTWNQIKGDKGDKGEDGTGIQETIISYVNHTNGTTAPTAGWIETVPTPIKGQYMWTRTVTKYTDNSDITTYSVAYNALDGQTGAVGADGKGIVATEIRYQQSVSGTTTPTGTWLTAVPTPIKGQYLWTRTTISYTQGSNSVSYSTSYYATDGQKGDKGDKGEDGVSITGITEHYLITNLSSGVTISTGGWTTNIPAMTEASPYLWNYEETHLSNGNKETTAPVIMGHYGSDGSDGLDGRGITGITEYYLTSSASSGIVVGSTGWSTAMKITTPSLKYLWNYSKIDYTQGNSTNTVPVIIGVHGEKGDQGDRGPQGVEGPKGLDGKTTYTWIKYADNASGSGISNSPTGKAYIGFAYNKPTSTESETPTDYIWSLIKGDQGNQGVQGPKGTDGQTTYTWIKYSATATGSGMTDTPQSNTEYIGIATNKTTATESSTASEYIWSLFKGPKGDTGAKGATGSQGPQGPQGTSVDSATEYYLASTVATGVTVSTSGWTTAMQPMTSTKKYLWNYEKINFSDGTSQNTIPVVIGVYGDAGDKGATGEEGRAILSITEYYLASASATGVTRSTDGWTTTMQSTDTIKKHLWNYEVVNWSKAPLVTYVEPIIIGIHGATGATGATGPRGATGSQGPRGAEGTSVTSIVEHYLSSASATGVTTATSGWTETTQPITSAKRYLWNYETINFSDSSSQNTIPVVIGVYGDTGSSGSNGEDGRSITGVTEHYLSTSASSNVTRTTGGWTTTMQQTDTTKKYLWNYETITWSKAPLTTYVEPIIIGVHGATGAQGIQGSRGSQGATGTQGPKGDTGTSVSSVTEYYLSSASNSGVTTATSGWSNAMQPISSSKKYLWNYEKINFSDGTSQNTIPVIMGVYGDTGPQGATGATGSVGDVGRSITGVVEWYLATASATGVTRSTSGWTTAMQVTTATKKYLWNYEVITWNKAPITTYVEPIIIGIQGDKGDTGSTGPQGPQGVSITGVDVEYAQNTSGTTAPTTGWSTTAPSWKDGQYIWSRTKTNYSTGNPTYSKPACITGQKGATGSKGGTGATGSKGDAGRGISSIVEQYYLSTSKTTQEGGEWVETPPMWVEGRYMWTRSKINYTNPVGTEYTTEVVDSAWEALEGVTLKDKTEILSGTEIFTDRADDAVVHVEVDGKSVGGGSGKNLIKRSTDMTVVASSTQAWTFDTLRFDTLTVGKRYVFSANVEVLAGALTNGSNISVLARKSNGDASTSFVGTTIQNGRIVGTMIALEDTNQIYLYAGTAGYTNGNTIRFTNIQLEQNDVVEDTPFEERVPEPDYPVAINSLNNIDVMSSVGKINLFSGFERKTQTKNGLTMTVNENGSIYFKGNLTSVTDFYLLGSWGTADKNPDRYLKPSKYTMSMMGGEGNRFSLKMYQGTTALGTIYKGAKQVINRSEGTYYSVLYFTVEATGNYDETVYIKLEEGDETPFNPAPEDVSESENYSSIDKTNILLSEPLRSVGGVKDRLFLDTDGLWKVERNVYYEELDSNTPNWSSYTGYDTVNTISTRVVKGQHTQSLAWSEFRSSHFPETINAWTKNEAGIGYSSAGGTSVWIQIPKSIANNLEEAKQWADRQKAQGAPIQIMYPLKENKYIETLDQELQQKLNNIQSYKDSNYVYTVLPDKSDILTPTLHATFKSRGWYDKYLTETELKAVNDKADSKADQDALDKVAEDLTNFETIVATREELGEVISSLNDYKEMIEANETDLVTASQEITDLLSRVPILENNLGAFTENWSFLDTYMTAGEEGLLIGSETGGTAIRISDDRIDFLDGSDMPVAFITNQVMQINRGIFVKSATIGEHKIETIAGGHTIFTWLG